MKMVTSTEEKKMIKIIIAIIIFMFILLYIFGIASVIIFHIRKRKYGIKFLVWRRRPPYKYCYRCKWLDKDETDMYEPCNHRYACIKGMFHKSEKCPLYEKDWLLR